MNALEELSGLADPGQARGEAARQALVDVTKQIRRRIGSAPVWPRPHQIVVSAYCALAGDRVLIADEQGTGKPNPVDSDVLTPAGWRKMGDVREGDWVIGSAGHPVRVLAVHPQGVLPSYRVSFDDGTSAEAGPRHLWTVYYWKGGKRKEPLTVTTDDLRLRPKLGRLDLSKTDLYLPTLSGPAQFSRGLPLPLDPYFVGQVISNGSCLASSLRSEDNRIPREYLLSSTEDRIALLHGLMDGAGSASRTNNRVSYSTKSLGLASDVVELVECLGGIATVHAWDRTKHNKGWEYHVRLRLPPGIEPFTISSRASRYCPGNRAHPTRRVLGVEYIRDVEQVCITVDADDGLYALRHAVLTHNSAASLLRILLGGYPSALIVCPPSPMTKWMDEVERWLPGMPARRLDKVDTWVPPPGWKGVVVTTWDLLRYHAAALARTQFSMIVADEAHYLLHADSERSVAFDTVRAGVPHLLLMTGTPLVNRARDMWRLLHMLDPRAWPDTEFMHRAFKELNKDDFDAGVHTRLTAKIRQYMVRRLKVAALPDLQEKKYQTIEVRLSPKLMAQYKQIEEQFDDWLEEQVRAKLDADIAEGRAADLDEALYAQEVTRRVQRALLSGKLVRFGKLRRAVGEMKVPKAAQWIVEAVQAREPVLVFAEHQQVLLALASTLRARGIRFGVLDGSTTKTRRGSLVKEFQGGKLDVMLASKAAREGIDLYRASHVLFVERFLTAAEEDQAADRVHRFGQKRQVVVWKMHALGTVDDRVTLLVETKRKISTRTVDTRASGAAKLGDVVSVERRSLEPRGDEPGLDLDLVSRSGGHDGSGVGPGSTPEHAG